MTHPKGRHALPVVDGTREAEARLDVIAALGSPIGKPVRPFHDRQTFTDPRGKHQ